MTETPGQDLLSSVLRSFRLRVEIFKQGAYCGAWALDSTGVAQPTFHLIGRGQAWVHTKHAREPLPVRGGDLVFFPHADWHQISGTPDRQPGMQLHRSGEGPFSTVLCATAEFDAPAANPVLRALPPVLIVRSEDVQTSAQLNALARVMLAEYEAGAAGRQGVLDRLAEAMFVMILRHHAEHAPELGGLLGALRDPRLSRALEAMHAAPGRTWTVNALAAEAGMSRTVFAERFALYLGETPMQYLAAWRMHLADGLLRDGTRSVAHVANELGYETEAAFRRAFKRLRGVGPGAVRRAARA